MKFNLVVKAQSIDDAWLQWWEELSTQHDNQSSRDGNVVGEVINAVTIIADPTQNILNNDIRKLSMKYAVGELLWYMSGNRELKEIQKYTKAWDRMSDDGVHVNSNYGYCIQHKYGFDQWEYVRELLRNNPDTRQAVIHIKEPNQEESKDVPCTIALQFFIRENRLHLTTYMRSNDIWLGFPYDVFIFCCQQVKMSMELGIELGSYTHVAGSLHLYRRDLNRNKSKGAEASG